MLLNFFVGLHAAIPEFDFRFVWRWYSFEIRRSFKSWLTRTLTNTTLLFFLTATDKAVRFETWAAKALVLFFLKKQNGPAIFIPHVERRVERRGFSTTMPLALWLWAGIRLSWRVR
jgi:hypothetical protein